MLVVWNGWVLFFFWLLALGGLLWFLQVRHLSRRVRSIPAPGEWPLVSVIVSARNEAAGLESCLRSIMELNYPNLEIVAVDDRSTDHTAEIIDTLAKTDRRLIPLYVDILPENWLGKNYAMYAGARKSKGTFLLFTDGDVIFGKNTLRKAIQYMIYHRVDHLSLAPKMAKGSYWESALAVFFFMMLLSFLNAWAISKPFKFAYGGIGAFNLLRKTVYDSLGGHETLRLEVVDDIELGKKVKRAGYRQDMLMAIDLLAVHWQKGLSGIVKGLEKNAFAGLGYSLTTMLLLTLFSCWSTVLPYVMVSLYPAQQSAGYWLAIFWIHFVFGFAAAKYAASWTVFPVFPVCSLLLLTAFWNSTLVTLRQGGIRWRETFYSLNLLRKPRPSARQRNQKPPGEVRHYRQSGVICYKIERGNIHILLITNRKGNRWIIPKGMVERGMSAAESAGKEALEEAGVLGIISPSSPGRYRYRKWGGICEVEVFFLRVTRLLEEWEEQAFRERSWYRLEEAVNLIRELELQEMIGHLPQNLR